jgi:predicted phosphoribosyltransferase
MLYKNREHAANVLATYLKKYKADDCIVLAIPRGGVPIGYYISKKLGLPLDILLTKKIGHPMNPEWAVGAVSRESRVLNPTVRLPEEYIESETIRLRKVLAERYKFYRDTVKPAGLAGKTVIIVDDGIATGNTLQASIQMVRTEGPRKIVIAVPVAPPETASRLSKMVNEFICPATPDDFQSVGQYYFDFSEVSDQEAVRMLKEIYDRPVKEK